MYMISDNFNLICKSCMLKVKVSNIKTNYKTFLKNIFKGKIY